MKTFAKLCAALLIAAAWFFAGNAPADAHPHHNWRRHCQSHYSHHHWHRHCHCYWHRHHRHHWRDTGWHRPRPSDNSQCKPRMEGIATGQGVFGLGSARARAAAIADFETKATNLYGAAYGRFSTARGVSWDCSKLALIRAKCVVTASPCP